MGELAQKTWAAFSGGRYTRNNLVKVSDDHVLVATNLIFPGDRIAHKRPGYTLVKAAYAGVKRIFDFRRQSDGAQFVILSGAGKIATMKSDGTNYGVLSAAEDANAIFDFATSVHSVYCSNGVKSYALLDVAGTLTQKGWGLAAPAAAPSIATGAGSLSLVYGRQYCYSAVRKWTDGQGVTRIHVGPPSPISAHTGKLANSVVTVGAIPAVPADLQTTHWWIWATNDTPFNSTSVFFFASEITVGTTSWGDTLADTSLDTTRQAPFLNAPPPAGTIIVEFEGCIAIGGIAGKPDLIQITGLAEITVGIPQECCPPLKFFNVPGGIKALVGGISFNENFLLATSDFWFQIAGVSSDTFSERDFILKPGLAARRAVIIFGGWMIWLGSDRKIWAWNGAGEPIELSWKIARADQSGALSMESLSATMLSSAELQVYSFGRYNVLVLAASTNGTYLDWFSLWDVSSLAGPAGPLGLTTEDGRLQISAESDMLPSHNMIASGLVMVGNTPYLFLADTNGNIYRWPDGWSDAGTTFTPLLGSGISDLDEPEVLKRMRWLDVATSRVDALTAFLLQAVAMDGPNANTAGVYLPLRNVPNSSQGGPDPTTMRGYLEQAKGASYGRLLRWWITYPADAQDCEVLKVVAKFSPINQR